MDCAYIDTLLIEKRNHENKSNYIQSNCNVVYGIFYECPMESWSDCRNNL